MSGINDDLIIDHDDTIIEVVLGDDKDVDDNDNNITPPDDNDEGEGTKKEDKKEKFVEVEVDDDDNSTKEVDESEGYGWKEMARFAIDKGVFTDTTIEELENMGNELDDLSELMQKEMALGIDRAKQEWIDNLNGQAKNLVNHIQNGGAVEDFIVTYSNSYEQVEESSLKEDAILQEKVVRDWYKKTTKWNDKKINQEIIRRKDLDELYDLSKEGLGELKTLESEEKKRLAEITAVKQAKAKEANEKRVTALEQSIKDVKEFIGIPVSPNLRKKIKDNVFNDATLQKINSDIDKYRVVLATLDAIGLLDGKTDVLDKVYTSKSTKQVKKDIENYNFGKTKSVGKRKRVSGEDAIPDIMSAIEKNSPFANI